MMNTLNVNEIARLAEATVRANPHLRLSLAVAQLALEGEQDACRGSAAEFELEEGDALLWLTAAVAEQLRLADRGQAIYIEVDAPSEWGVDVVVLEESGWRVAFRRTRMDVDTDWTVGDCMDVEAAIRSIAVGLAVGDLDPRPHPDASPRRYSTLAAGAAPRGAGSALRGRDPGGRPVRGRRRRRRGTRKSRRTTRCTDTRNTWGDHTGDVSTVGLACERNARAASRPSVPA